MSIEPEGCRPVFQFGRPLSDSSVSMEQLLPWHGFCFIRERRRHLLVLVTPFNSNERYGSLDENIPKLLSRHVGRDGTRRFRTAPGAAVCRRQLTE